MKESRKLFFKNKVFSKENLIYIGNLFVKDFNSSKKQNRSTKISFLLSAIDNTSYESDSIGIIQDGIIDIKKLYSIEFTYYDYDINRYMLFSITEGNSNSFIHIKGDDSNWVNKMFTYFTEYIESVKPHDNWIFKYKKYLKHILALGLGKILLSFFVFIFSLFLHPIENPTDTMLAVGKFINNNLLFFELLNSWIMPWILGLSWIPFIFELIANFWPKIEFDFGPEHMKEYKKRRRTANFIVTILIIPSAIMIIYDIVKYFISKF